MLDRQQRLLQVDTSSHMLLMPYLWTVVIDLAVIFAKYRYTKYGVIVHAIIALFVSLSTLATALPILLQYGIPAQ